MWQADYVRCYKNRTMAVTKCSTGEYFNPRLDKCMKVVQPGKQFLCLSGALKYYFDDIRAALVVLHTNYTKIYICFQKSLELAKEIEPLHQTFRIFLY